MKNVGRNNQEVCSKFHFSRPSLRKEPKTNKQWEISQAKNYNLKNQVIWFSWWHFQLPKIYHILRAARIEDWRESDKARELNGYKLKEEG